MTLRFNQIVTHFQPAEALTVIEFLDQLREVLMPTPMANRLGNSSANQTRPIQQYHPVSLCEANHQKYGSQHSLFFQNRL